MNHKFSSASSSSLRQSLGMPHFGTAVGDAGVHENPQPVRFHGATSSKLPPKSSGQNSRVRLGNHGVGTQQRQTKIGICSQLSTARSSIYGAGSQMKKDPRPLSDKSFQTKTIKSLIKFLSENNYPKSMTVKGLQNPTCKDFLHIFNFLLEHLDDSLVVDGMNIVEEVPAMLRNLGYPFNISKNHLLNVGSPHSWPLLLGALSWLMDCCSMPDNTDQIMFCRGQGFEDDEDEKFKDEYEMEAKAYALYSTHGLDSAEYQKLRNGRLTGIKKQCEVYKSEVVFLQEENAKLSAYIEELTKSTIPSLQNEVEQCDKEIEDMGEHINTNVLPAIETVEAEKAAIDLRASEMEVQIASSKTKIEELEEVIQAQSISATDAHELLQEIHNVEDMLQKKRVQEDDKMRRISELQMQHNKSVNLIDSKCQEINGKMYRLAALLPDVACLTPLDYNISKRADPGVIQKLISYAKHLREDVLKLDESVASRKLEYEGKIMQAQATQSMLHTEIVQEKLKVENLEHSLDVGRVTLEKKRKMNEEMMKTEIAERQLLEKQLITVQQQLDEETLSEKNYLAACSISKREIAAMDDQLKDKTEELKKLVDLMTEFTEALQDNQENIVQQVDQLAVKFSKYKIHLPHPDYFAPFVPPE